MTVTEIANIIYENNKDLFVDANEVRVGIAKFLYCIHMDICLIREKEYKYLGKTIITEEGKKNKKAAHQKRNAMIERNNNRYKSKSKKDDWHTRHIDIYFNLC